MYTCYISDSKFTLLYMQQKRIQYMYAFDYTFACMFIANLFCSVENSNTGLIMGLVVASLVVLLLFLLLIGILCLYCYRKKNQSCGKFINYIITFGDRILYRINRKCIIDSTRRSYIGVDGIFILVTIR